MVIGSEITAVAIDLDAAFDVAIAVDLVEGMRLAIGSGRLASYQRHFTVTAGPTTKDVEHFNKQNVLAM